MLDYNKNWHCPFMGIWVSCHIFNSDSLESELMTIWFPSYNRQSLTQSVQIYSILFKCNFLAKFLWGQIQLKFCQLEKVKLNQHLEMMHLFSLSFNFRIETSLIEKNRVGPWKKIMIYIALWLVVILQTCLEVGDAELFHHLMFIQKVLLFLCG